MLLRLLVLLVLAFSFSCTPSPKPPDVNKLPNSSPAYKLPESLPHHTNKNFDIDVSPMDIVYYPIDYPKLKMQNKKIGSPVMRVIYSRPHLQGRNLFTDILKYGQPWRLGANEATEIEFFKPVTIMRQPVAKGRYILYCMPYETTWQIILNTNINSWGLVQDSTMNVNKFTIPITAISHAKEYFTIQFKSYENKNKAYLNFSWANIEANLPIDL